MSDSERIVELAGIVERLDTQIKTSTLRAELFIAMINSGGYKLKKTQRLSGDDQWVDHTDDEKLMNHFEIVRSHIHNIDDFGEKKVEALTELLKLKESFIASLE